MEQKQSFLQRLMDKITPAYVTTYTRPELVIPPLDRTKFLAALAANETGIVKGDPYKFKQPSGNKKFGQALGRYQVTEGELKTYGSRYLGQPISPSQFLASSTAQDNYVTNKALELSKQGYTPQQIADIHRRGIRKTSEPGSSIYQDPDYVNKFNVNYNATSTTP
jgi:hypothetical protein